MITLISEPNEKVRNALPRVYERRLLSNLCRNTP